MDVNFSFNDAPTAEKIYFEQVYAEKPGGGLVANPTADLAPTTPVVYNADSDKFVLVEATDTTTTPDFILGDWVYKGQGDQLVRLVNGANIRKENAVITAAQAVLMSTIKLV